MVCLCGRVISNNLPSLLTNNRLLPFSNWQRYPIEKLYDNIIAYGPFRRMVDSLRRETAQKAVEFYRSRFAGFPGGVSIPFWFNEDLIDILASEGVLSRVDRPLARDGHYRVTSLLIDAVVRLQAIPFQFPNAPSVPVREIRPNVLDIPFVLTESLRCFDKDLVQSAYYLSYKKSTVPQASGSTQVPRESVYDTELIRILCNWLRKTDEWSVTTQWLPTMDKIGEFFNVVVLQKKGDNKPIILDILATEDPKSLRVHIEKIPESMALVSAVEGWVIHFICADHFTIPTWQTDAELNRGINVIHVSHNKDFTNVTFHVYSCSTTGQEKYDICI